MIFCFLLLYEDFQEALFNITKHPVCICIYVRLHNTDFVYNFVSIRNSSVSGFLTPQKMSLLRREQVHK